MALTQEELAAQARAAQLNGGRYDAQTNPGGLAGEGYKTNWPKGLNDTATLVGAVVREVDSAANSAMEAASAQVATEALKSDVVDAVGQMLGTTEGARDAAVMAQSGAEAARDAALAAVASANLPLVTAEDSGKVLTVDEAGNYVARSQTSLGLLIALTGD